MKRWQQFALAGALIGAIGIADGPAQAGTPQGTLEVTIRVYGTEAANITDVVPEVYASSDGSLVQDCTTQDDLQTPSPLVAFLTLSCTVAFGSYELGARNEPADYRRATSCSTPEPTPEERFTDPTVGFDIGPFGTTRCTINYSSAILFLDKVVTDPGEASSDPLPSSSDFTLEVFDSEGALVTSGTDPSDTQCTSTFAADVQTTCWVVDLPDGDYTLGELPVDGFAGSVPATCVFSDFDERLDDANASFTAAAGPLGQTIRCTISNAYTESPVTLTKTLTNDDGGTAALTDFTLELFDDDGVKVDEGVCDVTGACLSGVYPIGDYVVGDIGPDGYTRTVTQTITPLQEANEQLEDAQAAFSLQPLEQVTVNVDSDDIPTTTTTTLAPTTTTVAPTTSDAGAGVVTLPATGQTDQTGWIATVAALMLLLGAAALWTTRRP